MRMLFSIVLTLPLVYAVCAQPKRPSQVSVSSHALSDTLRKEAARVLAMPAQGHIHVRGNDLQMRLKNVIITPSLLWIHLQIDNRSHLNFQPAFCRFVIRSPTGAKRKAVQSLEVIPFRRPILGAVRYRHPYDLVVPFVPFALVKPQRLVIELGEARSGRLLLLRLPAKLILHASYLP